MYTYLRFGLPCCLIVVNCCPENCNRVRGANTVVKASARSLHSRGGAGGVSDPGVLGTLKVRYDLHSEVSLLPRLKLSWTASRSSRGLKRSARRSISCFVVYASPRSAACARAKLGNDV